jgi:serine/threonine-protein kinase PknG
MADQMLGVLREVLSAGDGVPRPSTSGIFTPGQRTFGSHVETLAGPDVAAALPLPLVDATDPGAAFLATLSSIDPSQTVRALLAVEQRTVEVSLALVRAYLDGDKLAEAADELREAGARARDWRFDWYRGLIALASGDQAAARPLFDDVYAMLPGEIAPRLALAAATELGGDPAAAARLYERVWCVDHEYPSAAFGLARTRLAASDVAGAVAVLDEIPDTSIQYEAAQVAALRARLDAANGEADLVDASVRLQRLRLDAERQATLSVEMFRAALAWLGLPEEAARPGNGDGSRPVPAQRRPVRSSGSRVLGQRLTERDLRLGLERSYRLLAAMQTNALARYALVDRANVVRPWTMV